MEALALFARGCLPACEDAGWEGTVAGAGRRTERTLCHPWSQQCRGPWGLWALGAVGVDARELSHPLQLGCPLIWGVPARHRLCQPIRQPAGLAGVSAAGCLAVLCPQTPSSVCSGTGLVQGAQDGKSSPQHRGWDEASRHPWGDGGQLGQEEAGARGIRLNAGTGPLCSAFVCPAASRGHGAVSPPCSPGHCQRWALPTPASLLR